MQGCRFFPVALFAATFAAHGEVGSDIIDDSPSPLFGSQYFDALDENGDGRLSPNEMTSDPELRARWRRLDRDGDNRLDREEFSGFDAGSGFPSTSGRDLDP